MTKNFIKTVSPVRSFSDCEDLTFSRNASKKALKHERKQNKLAALFVNEAQNAAFN